VINAMVYDPEHGLVDSPANPDQFELLPGVGEAICALKAMGFLILVVSNQPGVAKGKYTLRLLEAIDRKMESELARSGARLDGTYYCLHHPEAVVTAYRTVCECRKPKPGLLIQGAKDFDVALTDSYMIGDGLTDILAGRAVGATTILVAHPKCYLCERMMALNAVPDHTVQSLAQAARLIEKLEDSREDLY
jgi:D-glycero-D-manno-heptose 1,7-bisphosphate phosphatase